MVKCAFITVSTVPGRQAGPAGFGQRLHLFAFLINVSSPEDKLAPQGLATDFTYLPLSWMFLRPERQAGPAGLGFSKYYLVAVSIYHGIHPLHVFAMIVCILHPPNMS